MKLPTHSDVKKILEGILSGALTRQEVAAWAAPYLLNGSRISDHLLWNALVLMGAADLCSTDRPFLYENVDFQECLKGLEGSV